MKETQQETYREVAPLRPRQLFQWMFQQFVSAKMKGVYEFFRVLKFHITIFPPNQALFWKKKIEAHTWRAFIFMIPKIALIFLNSR